MQQLLKWQLRQRRSSVNALNNTEKFWTSESCDFCNSGPRLGCSFMDEIEATMPYATDCNRPECGWDGGDCSPGHITVREPYVYALLKANWFAHHPLIR